MPRPFKKRNINPDLNFHYFKPKAIPLSELEENILKSDELEAIRLKYLEKLEQTECANKMNISQSTFQRILSSANTKIADALVYGKAIKIEN